MITPAEIECRVAALRDMDDESAHSEEDTIHRDVLRAIAEGSAADPRACASEALKSLAIDFHRWCA